MKKRILVMLLSILLVINICSCNNTKDEVSTDDFSSEKLENLLNTNFPKSPFFDVVEGETILTNNEIKNMISEISLGQYDVYPQLHNLPQDAILYKNGTVIEIDLTDPRLIGLMNLYNNSVYYGQYAYTQGLLDIDYLNSNFLNEEFRLMITFTPQADVIEHHYDTNIIAYDTFIITNNSFVLIAHDLPGYEGQEEKYPFKAVGHFPLFYDYEWLNLFGF